MTIQEIKPLLPSQVFFSGSLLVHLKVIRINFHMKGFPTRLALKQNATQEIVMPIVITP